MIFLIYFVPLSYPKCIFEILLQVGSLTDHASIPSNCYRYWDPGLPSWEKEGEMCPRANFTYNNILRITYPSSSMHVFIAITSFLCHRRGTPPQKKIPLVSCPVFLFLWHVLDTTFFHKQQMDCCGFHLLICMVKVLTPWAEEGQAHGCLEARLEVGRCAVCAAHGSWNQEYFWMGKKIRDRWLSTLLYLAVYNSRLFLLWQSFLTILWKWHDILESYEFHFIPIRNKVRHLPCRVYV